MYERNGFTLIELLVVIAIIALLMSILMPALQRIRGSAKAVICQQNLHQWGLAFSSYADEYDGNLWTGDIIRNGITQYTWCIPLAKFYGENPDMLFCPMATKPREEGAQDPYASWGPWQWDNDLDGSYGMNNWCSNPEPGAEFVYDTEPTKYNWRNIHNVEGANRVPLFGDCAYIEAKPYDSDLPPQYEGDITQYATSGQQIKRFVLNRHSGFINLLFMDMSIKKAGLKEMWTFKWHKAFDTANQWTKTGGVMAEDWPKWMREFKDY